MKNTYNIPQKGISEINMRSFQKAFSILGLNDAEEKVKSADGEDVKDFTLELISHAKNSDLRTIGSLTKMVEAWSCKLNAYAWSDEVERYCSEKHDIAMSVVVKFLNKTHLIIVVDDMAQDSVLEYNMFAFDLREKYKDIYDFMVIDKAAFLNMKENFESCNDIYNRR